MSFSRSRKISTPSPASAPPSLENISYAGHIGRLYNLLRRNLADDPNPTISGETVKRACQLNGIDKPTRDVGLTC